MQFSAVFNVKLRPKTAESTNFYKVYLSILSKYSHLASKEKLRKSQK